MSGFDNALSISEMDVSDKPGNSLNEIQNYIDDNKFPNCMSSSHHKNKDLPYHFPTGHKVLIKRFVKDFQEKRKTKHTGGSKKEIENNNRK